MEHFESSPGLNWCNRRTNHWFISLHHTRPKILVKILHQLVDTVVYPIIKTRSQKHPRWFVWDFFHQHYDYEDKGFNLGGAKEKQRKRKKKKNKKEASKQKAS